MNSQIISLAIVLGSMQLSKKFNFDDPDTIFIIRCLYGASNLIIIALFGYIQFKINQKNDLTTLKYVEPASAMSGRENDTLVTTTVKDYDTSELKKAQKATLMGVAMMAFMHLYMQYTQPLVVQSIMPVKTVVENKLFQIHVLGKTSEDLKRPFKAPAGLFGQAAGGEVKTDKKSIQELESKANIKKDE